MVIAWTRIAQARCKEYSAKENKDPRGPTDDHSPIRLVRCLVHSPQSLPCPARTMPGCGFALIVLDSRPQCFTMSCGPVFPVTYVQTSRKTLIRRLRQKLEVNGRPASHAAFERHAAASGRCTPCSNPFLSERDHLSCFIGAGSGGDLG